MASDGYPGKYVELHPDILGFLASIEPEPDRNRHSLWKGAEEAGGLPLRARPDRNRHSPWVGPTGQKAA